MPKSLRLPLPTFPTCHQCWCTDVVSQTSEDFCVCVCARSSSLSPDSACKHVETSTARWCVVDVSVAWTHWSKTRNLFLLPSVIIFWWLVCFSRARYQPNILSQSPVCTHCSINPMNRPFDWWGMAQECWEIGRARGGVGSPSEIGGGCGGWGAEGFLLLWRVTCDTCLNISPLILKRHRAGPTFLEPGWWF